MRKSVAVLLLGLHRDVAKALVGHTDALTAERDAARNARNEMLGCLDDALAKNVDMDRALGQLTAERDALRAQVEQLRAERNDQWGKRKDREREVDELRRRVRELEAERDQLVSAYNTRAFAQAAIDADELEAERALGRADERAAVVAWLAMDRGYSVVEANIEQIERGDHVRTREGEG